MVNAVLRSSSRAGQASGAVMARSPQGAGAQKKPGRKRAAKPIELPPSPRALGIDDLMGEFAGMGTPAPAASIDLDDILGELAGPAEAPATPTATATSTDLGSLLDDLIAPRPDASPADVDPLDDILGELPAAPLEVAAAAPHPLDSLLDDMAAPVEVPDGVMPVAAAQAGADSAEPARKVRKARLSLRSLPLRVPALAGIGMALIASHALAFWLGTLAHTAATPEGPVAGESAHVVVPELQLEGIARFAGKEMDARIDGKTMFEDEAFRAAVDELVGGPEAIGALETLLPKVRATQPIMRKGNALGVRACNPEACGLENLTVQYDTATRQAVICVTQGLGDPPVAASSLYDGEGAREVPNCEGYPHPPKPRPRPEPAAEPDDPADITFSAGAADRGSISFGSAAMAARTVASSACSRPRASASVPLMRRPCRGEIPASR